MSAVSSEHLTLQQSFPDCTASQPFRKLVCSSCVEAGRTFLLLENVVFHWMWRGLDSVSFGPILREPSDEQLALFPCVFQYGFCFIVVVSFPEKALPVSKRRPPHLPTMEADLFSIESERFLPDFLSSCGMFVLGWGFVSSPLLCGLKLSS